jgi:hypothetical protein
MNPEAHTHVPDMPPPTKYDYDEHYVIENIIDIPSFRNYEDRSAGD